MSCVCSWKGFELSPKDTALQQESSGFGMVVGVNVVVR